MKEDEVREKFATLRDAMNAEAEAAEEGLPDPVQTATLDLLEGALINLARLANPPPIMTTSGLSPKS